MSKNEPAKPVEAGADRTDFLFYRGIVKAKSNDADLGAGVGREGAGAHLVFEEHAIGGAPCPIISFSARPVYECTS